MSGNNPPPGSQHPQGNPPQGGQGGPGQGGFGQQGGPGFSQPGGPQQGGPRQGGPQQGGPQQGGQNPYGSGGPGQPPRGPGGPGPQGKNSGGNKKLFIILGSVAAAVIVLALIIGIAVLGSKKDPVADPATSTAATEEPAKPATKASDAVQGYLDALAANNPEAALGFASNQPAETSLLTADVMKASADAAPITEINVPEVTDQYGAQVSATYRMGSKKVSEKFYVSKADDDAFKISEAVVDLDVSRIKNTDVPLTINGVEITDEMTTLSIFPGSYEFSSGLKNLDYGDSTLLVKSPGDYPSTSELRLEITADGKKAFIAASKTALNTCVKQKKLAPSGCPNQVGPPKSGAKYKKGSITWKVSGNPFSGMDPRLDYDDPSLATASASLKFNYEATVTQSGRSGRSKGTTYEYAKFVVDLTKDDPKATFE